MTSDADRAYIRKAETHTIPGERLRAMRIEAGWTQREAAAAVRTNLRSWQRAEAGLQPLHAGLAELFTIKVQTARRIVEEHAAKRAAVLAAGPRMVRPG
jgi:transcriptional regulator with XRE-family HTH domain